MASMATTVRPHRAGAHLLPLWFRFLKESGAKMQRDDYHRGMGYTADPHASTRDAVADYMQAFGAGEVGATELVSVLHRDRRGIQRALAELVSGGELTVSESATMHSRTASRRKAYSTVSKNNIAIPLSLIADHFGSDKFREHWNGEDDEYFSGTLQAEELPGRQIPPRYVEYDY